MSLGTDLYCPHVKIWFRMVTATSFPAPKHGLAQVKLVCAFSNLVGYNLSSIVKDISVILKWSVSVLHSLFLYYFPLL